MKKFFVTLVKSVFFSWLLLFVLVYPAVVLGAGVIEGLDLGHLPYGVGNAAIVGFTGLIFASFWVRAYAGSFASLRANLRMKWDLRRVAKD